MAWQTDAVLLDMGGVVLDMGGGRGLPTRDLDWRGREALIRLIRSHDGHVDEEALELHLFAPWRRQYERRSAARMEAAWSPHLDRLREVAGVDLSDDELLDAWFRPYGERLRPIPEIAATLQALERRDMPIALVSNVPLPGRHYRRVLERLDLRAPFDHLFFSYDAGSRKPSPAMIRRALTALGVAPESAIMVGDRRDRDVAAGRLAGTKTVWVRSADGGGPSADVTIERVSELPALMASRDE